MIEKLKQQYSDFKILEHETGWTEVMTPFLLLCNDCISVYIKDNVIDDDGDMLRGVEEIKVAKVKDFISTETKYWNYVLSINEDKEIIVTDFTPEQLMPFIQLLIKIQGVIEYETQK